MMEIAQDQPDLSVKSAHLDRLAPTVAVLIPCFNEASAIADVVLSFRKAIAGAIIYVYDNNSTDDTATNAAQAGAVVRQELYQGKGNVVRRMFADVDSDVFVLVDGDGTYDATSAAPMIELLVSRNLDMVNGARRSNNAKSYRRGHQLGNNILSQVVRFFFGAGVSDMLSGYRVMSRRFVKSFPGLSGGFEIETELTAHALQLRLPIAELPTPYRARTEGAHSKLNTFRDGIRITRFIGRMIRDEKPLQFFGSLSLGLFTLAMILVIPVLLDYFETGLVARFPTLFVAIGLVTISVLLVAVGLILDTLSRVRMEVRRLAYQALKAPDYTSGRLSNPTSSYNSYR